MAKRPATVLRVAGLHPTVRAESGDDDRLVGLVPDVVSVGCNAFFEEDKGTWKRPHLRETVRPTCAVQPLILLYTARAVISSEAIPKMSFTRSSIHRSNCSASRSSWSR